MPAPSYCAFSVIRIYKSSFIDLDGVGRAEVRYLISLVSSVLWSIGSCSSPVAVFLTTMKFSDDIADTTGKGGVVPCDDVFTPTAITVFCMVYYYVAVLAFY